MIQLFAKRDTSAEPRDQYGRWMVGHGNANAARSYALFHLKERPTAMRLATDARAYAGKAGEHGRRSIFEANGRDFAGAGHDKLRTAMARLKAVLAIHEKNMQAFDAEKDDSGKSDQGRVRAAIFAHALQHGEGPLGRLTPTYRDMIRRKVKAASADEGTKMEAAMAARKPRTKVAKFNQDHDGAGRFAGPGGSHDPTGNPRGRPSGPGAGPSTRQALGQAALDVTGGAVGGYAGAALAGAAGGFFGGPVGAAVGSVAGKYAGSVLGSLAGDYVAAKIGQMLFDLKGQADGHPVGTGETIGAVAGMAVPLAAAAIPGGGAVAAGAREFFSPANQSLVSHFAEEGISGSATAAGHYADQRSGSSGGGRVKKSLFEGPKPNTDDFGAMANASLPNLFGPRAWKKIAGTPFGNYVRQKVKETADKMDDAAEAHGIGLKPASQQQIGAAQGVAAQAQAEQQAQEAAQQQAAQQQQQAQRAPGAPGGSMAKNLFAFPNDAVSRQAAQSGGPANARFIARMQETERKSRQTQVSAGPQIPRVENLAQQPGEDEQAYRKRVVALMAAAVRAAPGRASLFKSRPTVYRVRKVASPAENDDEPNWAIEAEIAKEFNDEDTLKQGLVYGWASIIEKDGETVTDHQGDRIEPDELVKAAHDFVTNSRNGGVLHDEYGHQIGRIVESCVFTKELQKALGVDLGKVGWLIGYQVSDPRVKAMVRAGVLKSFSIGGRGRRIPVKDAA